MNSPQHRRSLLRRACTAILAVTAFIMASVIVAWLLGRIINDRYAWSQWLWWIPTVLVLPAAVIGYLCAFRSTADRRTRRARLWRWGIVMLVIGMYFVAIEHRFLRRSPKSAALAQGIRIAHWNVEPVGSRLIEPSAEQVIAMNADITILTNPGAVVFDAKMKAWMGEERTLAHSTVFAVISRFPILQLRPLIVAEQIYVSLAEFERPPPFSESLTMLLIDLPSEPRVPRRALMQRVASMLAELNVPDVKLVIGDFNIPRGSASIREAIPGKVHAFDRAGTGYAGTFHRAMPLWHIDHVFARPDVNMIAYTVTDPGISRHRIQMVVIGPAVR